MINYKDIVKKKYRITIGKRYWCKNCGYNCYRNNVEGFLVDPLNASEFNTLKKEVTKRLENRIRKCPKCSNEIKPTNIET